MDFKALCTDYDLTLTATPHLAADTIAALKELKASGRKLVLITGRSLTYVYGPDGILTREEIELFDRVVGENGAVMWDPKTDKTTLLGSPPSPELIKRMRDAGMTGYTIAQASIHVPLAEAGKMLRALGGLNVNLHAIEGTHHQVYVDRGINKGSGMRTALAELGLTPADAAAIGDGLNDIDMVDTRLSGVGIGIAVGDAQPALKAVAGHITKGGAGAAIREVIAAVVRPQLDQGGLDAAA